MSYIPWAFPPPVVSSYVMFSFFHRCEIICFYFVSHETALESYKYYSPLQCSEMHSEFVKSVELIFKALFFFGVA